MQVQIGMWFLTWHSALIPQVPGQGSIHLFLLQALLNGQSEWTTHSGLHAMYGSPKYSGIHWQEAADLSLLQTAFDPHGDGLQGSITSTLGGTKIKILYFKKIRLNITSCFLIAGSEGIPSVACITNTRWEMIVYWTSCMISTNTRTWISALILNTS